MNFYILENSGFSFYGRSFPFSFYVYGKIFYFLFLFFKDGNNVNGSAAGSGHQQHLHRADTLVSAANFFRGINVNCSAFFIFSFKMESIIQPFERDFHIHAKGRERFIFAANTDSNGLNRPHAAGRDATDYLWDTMLSV